MCLLYSIEGEVAIEMSREAWAIVESLVALRPDNWTLSEVTQAELTCFANKVRSHLQHLEAERTSPPPPNNTDLI